MFLEPCLVCLLFIMFPLGSCLASSGQLEIFSLSVDFHQVSDFWLSVDIVDEGLGS